MITQTSPPPEIGSAATCIGITLSIFTAACVVTPQQRHTGQDSDILSQCHQLYKAAKVQHPERWSGPTRNKNPIGEVWLNQPGEAAPDNVRKAP